MAEVVDIKAPIDKPIEAPDANELAGLERAQQGNTAQIGDPYSPRQYNEDLLHAQQINYALNEAKAQKQQKAIDDALSKVDFNTTDILPQDSKEIYGDIKNIMGTISKDPSILLPNPKDPASMQKYSDFKNQQNSIYQKIDTSKWWAARDKLNQDKTFANPNDPYNTNENKQAWDKTLNTAGVLNRQVPQFSQKDPFNIDKIVGNHFKEDDITEAKTYTQGQGNQVIEHTVKAPTLETIKQKLDAVKNDPNDYKDLMHHFADLKLQAIEHKFDPVVNPDMPIYDLSKKNKDQTLPIVRTVKLSEATPDEIINSTLAQRFNKVKEIGATATGARESLADGKTDKAPLWAAEYANDIINGKVEGAQPQETNHVDGKGNKIVTGTSTFNPVPSDWTDKKNGKEVVGIVTVNGKYYKAYDDDVTSNDAGYKYAPKDVIKPENQITNMWLQVIKPNHSKEELDNYAKQIWKDNPEAAKKLGVPNPIGSSSSTASPATNVASPSVQNNVQYEYQGKTFTYDDVAKKAAAYGGTIDEYLKAAGIKVKK